MKSLLSFWLCALTIIGLAFAFVPRWEKENVHSTFGWDVGGYYWYLPSVFIYHDLKGQQFGDSVMKHYQFSPSFDLGSRQENGGYVLTYSSGMALLYSPFFFAGHLLAKPLGYPADGFSLPYRAAISWGSLLVAVLSLWYYRKFLRYYCSDGTVTIVLLLLTIGSNYLNYTAIDGALTHNWLFLLYVLLLLATRAYHLNPKPGKAVAIGLLCGLCILVRPSEIICVLIPLLWGLESLRLRAVRERMRFLGAYRLHLLLTALAAVSVGSIQLFYWKYASGHWLVYSYGGKTFSWLHPHFLDYVFSYRSGWLTYTPLVILLVPGFVLYAKWGANRVMVFVFSVINLYIIASWDIWWYGGTGGRAMIQSYPVMFLSLALLVEYLLRHRKLLYIASPFILLFAYFNIWFTVQAHGGAALYDPESMTNAYYWHVVGRWKADSTWTRYKDSDELYGGPPPKATIVALEDFEADTAAGARENAIQGGRSLTLDREHPWSNAYRYPFKGDAKWIRVTSTFRIGAKQWTPWLMTQMIVAFRAKGETVKQRAIRAQRYLNDGETKAVSFELKVPEEPVDTIEVKYWNVESPYPVEIDQLVVEKF